MAGHLSRPSARLGAGFLIRASTGVEPVVPVPDTGAVTSSSATRSVAPPGWVAPTPAPVSVQPVLVADPDRALNARIRAGLIDGVLVGCFWGAVCALLGWSVDQATHWLPALVLPLIYFAAFELARDGQTIGKRQTGVRVVRADGQPLDLRTVAIRTAFRLIDSVPVGYASGLISVWRTGAQRRQRLGDVVAGTLVVPSGERLRPDRPAMRALPIATVVSIALSALLVVGLVTEGGSRVDRTAFVNGCNTTAQGRINCGCLFDQLHDVYGIRTKADFRKLEEQIRTALVTGNVATLPPDYVAAVTACRQ